MVIGSCLFRQDLKYTLISYIKLLFNRKSFKLPRIKFSKIEPEIEIQYGLQDAFMVLRQHSPCVFLDLALTGRKEGVQITLQ